MANVHAPGTKMTSPPWKVERIRRLFAARRGLFAQSRGLGEQSRELNVRISDTARRHRPFAAEVERLGRAAPPSMRDQERQLRESLERDRAEDKAIKAERDRISQLAGAANHQAVELLKCLPDASAIDEELPR